jgi:ribosomal protein L11 methyltransferase
MYTIKIHFTNCTVEQQELLMAQLQQDFEIQGFEQMENALIAYMLEQDYEEANFNTLYQKEATPYTTEKIPDQNWNAVWESNFEPVLVDNFCAIRANFHEPITTVQHEIVITPKMSFGTGHHATTYQVIKAMQGFNFKQKKVCDFGTGTGVLAILAEQLGAVQVIAIDNDDWSIENAKENIAINHCHRINLLKNEQVVDNEYDIILANINRNVLLANMPQFYQLLRNDGMLLLSGILQEDLEAITASLRANGFTLTTYTEKNNWLCITAHKD